MNLKTNAILAVAFAGLLAFVYIYEIKGGEEREAAEEREKKQFSMREVIGYLSVLVISLTPLWLS